MEILIPHSWLKEFLKTSAKPEKIAEALLLSGPTVERLASRGGDFVYQVEVTTNRVDAASVYGLAREAAAILPRFGAKAKLLPVRAKANQKTSPKAGFLEVKVDHNLCPRFTAILIRDVTIKSSPDPVQKRLHLVGTRPINNVVDISNYLMHELGQPVHTFDYDKIKKKRMILRASKKGEKLTTLDNKTHKLPGGDIVIEDGQERLIDLAGIMGGKNSEVDQKTRNVLLFVQTYNPVNIRKTSIALAQRSQAAALFEKGLDPELVEITIRRGIDLFVQLTGGKPEAEILDLYPNPYQEKRVKTTLEFLNQSLGTEASKEEVEKILTALGFKPAWKQNSLSVGVPSWRGEDINIPEDIVEEVTRIYGYQNLPSSLMQGKIPDPLQDSPFEFEEKVKRILKGWGGVEIYTSSLVAKDRAALATEPSWVLKLKNPLGPDSEYLRLSLAPSLVWAAQENKGEKQPFHLFEMSNVYLPIRGKLPEEKLMLAGVFSRYSFPKAKGIVEALLQELGVEVEFEVEDARGFTPYKRLSVKHKKTEIGQMGILEESGLFYYELDLETLRKSSQPASSYQPPAKYPAQVEDISLVLPKRTLVGQVMETIRKTDKRIVSTELFDTYKNTRTFRVSYQDPGKTLTDKEVEKIRAKITTRVKKQFGARPKS